MLSRRRVLFFAALAASPAIAAALTVTVIVRTAPIKKKPQVYAPTAATVKLGDAFSTSAARDGWYPISPSDSEGWLHESAVSSEEIPPAGIGFNGRVEGAYKNSHPDLNFAAVDAMERVTIPEPAVLKFAQNGGFGGAR